MNVFKVIKENICTYKQENNYNREMKIQKGS